MRVYVDKGRRSILFLSGGTLEEVKEFLNSLPDKYNGFDCGPYVAVVEKEKSSQDNPKNPLSGFSLGDA